MGGKGNCRGWWRGGVVAGIPDAPRAKGEGSPSLRDVHTGPTGRRHREGAPRVSLPSFLRGRTTPGYLTHLP